MAQMIRFDRDNQDHNLYPGTAITYTRGAHCIHLDVVEKVDFWRKGKEIETRSGARVSFKDVETFANSSVK
jgi:hypothetical protein